MTRRFAVALAAAGLLVSVGCSKDETVTSTSSTAPVTASSSGGGSGTTEPTDDTTDTTDPEDADKDGGSGEYAEACTAIEELEALDEASEEEDSAATFALMEEARDAGPDELVDHWDTLIGVLEELDALGDSDEAMTRAFELFEDPEFIEAAGAIDDFASEECGIEIDLDPSGQSPGGLSEEDDTTETTDPDADPTSIDAVQAHLADVGGTEDWWPVFDDASSWGSTGSGGSVTWSVTFSSSSDWESLSDADIEKGCNAMAEYLDTYEDGDVTIEITDPDETVIVSREPGELCQAV